MNSSASARQAAASSGSCLTLQEYEAIRGDGTRFLLKEGHEDIEIEHVVALHAEHIVVEKDGVAGVVALDDDPRAGE